MDRKRQNRILILLVLLASIPCLFVQHLPLQDLPDWTLQAKILNNLDDPRFSPFYALKILPVPNCLGTLLMTGFGKTIGEINAARTLAFLIILLFTFGFVYLIRADGRFTPHLEIFGVLFALNHFFMMGYFNFVLGLSIAFYAIGYYWRRAPNLAKESTFLLALLLIFVYLAHFLAFLIAGVVIFCIAWRTWFGDRKKYTLPILSLIPSLLLLVWYALGRHGSFDIGYEYTFLNFIWYKVAPFAPLSNFYPVTPASVAWGVVVANILAIGGILAFSVWLIFNKLISFRSPLPMAALILVVIGMIAPTKFFELIRPGQRLIFGAFFIFLAGVEAPRFLRRQLKTFFLLMVTMVIAVNSLNITNAGRRVDNVVDLIERKIPAKSTLLILNDSHFEFDEEKSLWEKLKNPFSYPAWVNALKSVGYYHLANHGGILGYLFPSGILKVVPTRPPAVNSIEQLKNTEISEAYTHIIISGRPKNVLKLTDAAKRSFITANFDGNFAILEKKPPVEPMNIGDIFYLWMPVPESLYQFKDALN